MKTKHILVILCVGLIVKQPSFAQQRQEEITSNSTNSDLQILVTKNEKHIEKYYKLWQESGKVNNPEDSLSKAKSQLDSTFILLDVLSDTVNVMRDELKNSSPDEFSFRQYKKIKAVTNEIKSLSISIDTYNRKCNLYRRLIRDELKYQKAVTEISDFAKNVEGEIRLSYNGEAYIGYVVNSSLESIETFHKSTDFENNSASIADVRAQYAKKGVSPNMITNGGMYTSSFSPEGLLVVNGQKITEIDLAGPKENLNFYLTPNGVFFSEENDYRIFETNEFNEFYSKGELRPRIATQSGPLLVYKGQHHPKLNYGSKSKRLRSGVGVMPNGNVVFLISKDHNTNFFQFATLFKDVFGCQDALFLDGEISRMYLKELNPNEKGGRFGPMLVVYRKNSNSEKMSNDVSKKD